MIIAIDGPAASGKTTTAAGVAARLGYRHIDTGAMYRAVTLHFLRQQVDLGDPDSVLRALQDLMLNTDFDKQGQVTRLKDEDVRSEIRTPRVTETVAEVSALAPVRAHLLGIQRALARRHDVVLEGRDIGTVVFPDAELKIFMIADLKVRAERRQRELADRGIHVDLAQIASEIEERDSHNANRDLAPMIPAEDAIQLDTSAMSIDQQIDFIVSQVEKLNP